MLLPIRSKNPPESFPFATVVLIAVNILVFLATTQNFVIRVDIAYQYGVIANELHPLNLFFSQYLHAEPFHLLGNLWFLYLFGFAVEGRLRTARFLVLYTFAGVAGALLQVALSGALGGDKPMIGASGAIMGVLGAALFMFPYGKIDIFVLWGILYARVITWPIWGVGLMYLGLDLLQGMIGGSSVANWAHIGGAGAGFLCAMLLQARRDSSMASDAKAMYAEVKDLSILSPGELASMVAANPQDTDLALNWIHRSLRDGRGPSTECKSHFMSNLPRIAQHESPAHVAWVVAALSHEIHFQSSLLLDVGRRVEQSGDSALALRLYETLFADANASPADREPALFRMGILCEKLSNPDRAATAYMDLMREFPMGPFADQAKLRLSSLRRATT